MAKKFFFVLSLQSVHDATGNENRRRGGDQGFLGTGSFLCSLSSDATKYNLGVQVRLVSLPAT